MLLSVEELERSFGGVRALDGAAVQVARGELPAPDEDVLADRYLMADDAFAGLGWYEVSNCEFALQPTRIFSQPTSEE